MSFASYNTTIQNPNRGCHDQYVLVGLLRNQYIRESRILSLIYIINYLIWDRKFGYRFEYCVWRNSDYIRYN